MRRVAKGSIRVRSCLAIASLLFLVTQGDAWGHARMVRSAPVAEKQVQSPDKIDLWFNERLDGQFHTIEVFPAAQLTSGSHTNLANGEPVVDPNDRTHLSVAVRHLEHGDYVVQWRVLSLDGHSAPGRFKFTVARKK